MQTQPACVVLFDFVQGTCISHCMTGMHRKGIPDNILFMANDQNFLSELWLTFYLSLRMCHVCSTFSFPDLYVWGSLGKKCMAKSLKYQNDPIYSNIMSENMVKHADLKKKSQNLNSACWKLSWSVSSWKIGGGGKLNRKYCIFCFFYVPGIMLYTLQALSYLNVGIVLCSF